MRGCFLQWNCGRWWPLNWAKILNSLHLHIVASLVLQSLDNGFDVVEICESHVTDSNNVINVFKILLCLSSHLALEVIDALQSIRALITAAVALLLEAGRPLRLIQPFAPFVHLLLRDGEVTPRRGEFLLQLLVMPLL